MTQYQSEISRQITYHLNEKQYVAAIFRHSSKAYRNLFLAVAFASAIIGISSGSLVTGLLVGVGFVAYLGLIMLMVSFKLKKIFRDTPQLNCEQTVQWDEEGLATRNRLAISKVHWQIFTRFEVNDNFYFLYMGPAIFTIIPKTAFSSEEQEDTFRMLLELNVQQGKWSKRKPRKVQ